LKCGVSPAFVLRISGAGGLLELGEVGGFTGSFGVAADGGGRLGEAPREQGRPWVALDGNLANIAGGGGGVVDEVELEAEVALW
jgi:hypothetical protein